MTRSAPHLKGSCKGGGANVESTAMTAPAACAFLASATSQDRQGEERDDCSQASIERDSPVGFSGVSSHTSTFLSVGYASSRWMMLCVQSAQVSENGYGGRKSVE